MNAIDRLEARKKKSIKWILGFAILLFATYFFAIQNTLNLLKERNELRHQTESYIEWQEYLSTKPIVHNYIDKGKVQQALFGHINKAVMDSDMLISSLHSPHEFLDNGFIVNTFVIKLKGSFKSMLQLTHKLESEFESGKVVGFRFVVERDNQSRNENLFLYLVVQSVGEDHQ